MIDVVCTTGGVTLGGRGVTTDDRTENLLHVVQKHRLVAQACLAYQTYSDAAYRHLFPNYLQEVLENFKIAIKHLDVADTSVLMTGILLCSINV
jgi:hypothetical protein